MSEQTNQARIDFDATLDQLVDRLDSLSSKVDHLMGRLDLKILEAKKAIEKLEKQKKRPWG